VPGWIEPHKELPIPPPSFSPRSGCFVHPEKDEESSREALAGILHLVLSQGGVDDHASRLRPTLGSRKRLHPQLLVSLETLSHRHGSDEFIVHEHTESGFPAPQLASDGRFPGGLDAVHEDDLCSHGHLLTPKTVETTGDIRALVVLHRNVVDE
jgi:hypothetical protein